MATIVGPVTQSRATPETAAIPWINYAVLFAATSAVVGVIWDISWHRTIGRDTFWTPAHMAIYLSGIVAGTACGWLVLRTTFFGTPDEKAAGVSFWGFRGPLGAWLCIWGAIAMITSAPFDNWWHNAYGLDVKVLSPPHTLLALGFTAIELGALLFVVARQNRAMGVSRQASAVSEHVSESRTADARLPTAPLHGFFVAYGMGVLLCNFYIMGFEYIAFPNDMHKMLFYQICSLVFPVILVAAARAARLRWPATTAAAVYMAIHLLMIWILQLFSATPKLAPIYNPLTHMVPPPFPIVLVVPAFAIDLVLHRLERSNEWYKTVFVAASFVGALFLTQWWFLQFLISPASENFLFGQGRWNYNSHPGSWMHEFWDPETSPLTGVGFAIALGLAFVSARLGFWWGNWMTRVQR